MAITKVIREAARYAKNNAPKRVKQVTRSPKGKRADVRAARLEQRRGNTKTRFVEEKVKTKRKPPTKDVKPPKGEKIKKGGVTTKGGARKMLRKFGVPGKIIAGVLALTAANQLSKPKATKTKTPGPGNKSNAPNPFNNINPPAKRQGPGRPTMTSMVAKPPKPRNKNVTRRPKRPSKQGSFGR